MVVVVGGGGQESLASYLSSRELRSGAESFRMPAHLSCLQVQPLLGKKDGRARYSRTVWPTGKVPWARQ